MSTVIPDVDTSYIFLSILIYVIIFKVVYVFELDFLGWCLQQNPQQYVSTCFIVFNVLKLFPSYHCKSAENTFHTTHIDREAVLTADAHPLKLKLLCNYFCFLISLSGKKKLV